MKALVQLVSSEVNGIHILLFPRKMFLHMILEILDSLDANPLVLVSFWLRVSSLFIMLNSCL